MKKLTITLLLLPLVILLSGWGYKGHRIISQNMAGCLPSQLGFLKPNWTNFVMNHASDADSRKPSDPNESPRHYIDIENYPEFGATGRIPQLYDSVVALHGGGWVIDQGILPWATFRTYDSLKNALQRGDWNASELFAADLGHYVGDGHQPLHITSNYDGQATGQNGIHSRYETKMVGTYESQLVYPADSVHYISNVQDYIFTYIYSNHRYVDSLLLADTYAKAQAGGSVTTTTYYQALWEKTGPFTIMLMRNASCNLASLIYTAWVEAGSPMLYPNAISEPEDVTKPRFTGNFPNPFRGTTTVSLDIPVNNTPVNMTVYDAAGNLKEILLSETLSEGTHMVKWDASRFDSGVYVCVLRSGNFSVTRKMVLVK